MVDFLNSYGILISTGMAALAAIFSAFAAWKAPKWAAKSAAEYQQIEEKLRLRRFVLFTLMQERERMYTPSAVQAYNSIDIVFHDQKKVREAWADLYHALRGGTPELQAEKNRVLIREMAIVMGFEDDIGRDDLSRTYYPIALQNQDLMEHLQRENVLQTLISEGANPTANTASPNIVSTPTEIIKD